MWRSISIVSRSRRAPERRSSIRRRSSSRRRRRRHCSPHACPTSRTPTTVTARGGPLRLGTNPDGKRCDADLRKYFHPYVGMVVLPDGAGYVGLVGGEIVTLDGAFVEKSRHKLASCP